MDDDSALLLHPACLQSYLYWLTDSDIEHATPFDGWRPEFHDTYGNAAWSVQSRHRNAWHCRHLARAMQDSGGWVGEPVFWKHSNNHKLDGGNHRVRAAQWLFGMGVVVLVPLMVR